VLLSSDQVKGNTQSERSAKRSRYSRLHAVPTISYGNMWALDHVSIYVSEDHIMSDTDRVWELMKKIGICMLASWDGQELQARPMGAYVQPDEHAVFFLADARHHKEDDIKRSVSPSPTPALRITSRLPARRRSWSTGLRLASCGVFQLKRGGSRRMIQISAC
jgi:hypothetical protein